MSKSPREHIDSLREQYITRLTPSEYRDDFKRENNIENETVREYHGREILELLQNADDAYTLFLKKNPAISMKDDVSVLFEYKDGTLRVSNKGEPFDLDSIKSLCQGNNSTKDRGEFIGNKGIGFRALLNWSDDIKITSGEYSIQFSSKIANKHLKLLKERNDIVRIDCEKNPDLNIPMLSVPEWNESGNKKAGFDTTIELNVVGKTDGESVDDQVKKFDAFTLIFLRNVTSVSFLLESEHIRYFKQVTKESLKTKVSIWKTANNETVCLGDFYYFDQNEGTFGPKFAIAVPCNFDKNFRGKMYTFFPILNKISPFPALLHATFDLPPDRNSINAGERNRTLFKELLDFFVQQVTLHFSDKENILGCLSILKPINFKNEYDFDSPFSGLFIDYLDICKKYVQLQTVNGTFATIASGLKLNENYPKSFKGELFKDLVCSNICDDFVQTLLGNNSCYSLEELTEKINTLTEITNVAEGEQILENVEIFNWWINKYGKNNSVPHLLKNQQGEWLHGNERCLFPKDGKDSIKEMPQWANFTILNENYCNVLVDFISQKYPVELEKLKNAYESNSSNKRLVIGLIKEKSSIDFREYSVINLISPLNALIGDNIDYCVDFLKWMFSNRGVLWDENLDKIYFRLPDCDLDITLAKNLYFSTSYGSEYELTESLLGISKQYHAICDHELFDFLNDDSDLNDLVRLLKKMGVVERSPIKTANSSDTIPFVDGFKDYFFNSIVQQHREIRDDFEFTLVNSKLRYIDSIFLTQPLNSNVFQWLIEINSQILSLSDAVYFKASRQKKNYNPGYFSYLYFYIRNIKWINIDGNNYSLSECFITENESLKRFLPSCITPKEVKCWCNSVTSPKELKRFLQSMDVPEKFSQLPSNILYSLLISLSKDGSREAKDFTRRIYRQCFLVDNIENLCKESDNRKQFSRYGLVLSRLDDQFHPHSEVFFSNRVEVNLMHKHLLHTPLRTGDASKAKSLFFVEKFEEQISLEKYFPAESDLSFQERLRKYLPFVYCHRRDKATETEKRTFKEWKIRLASEVFFAGELRPSQSISDFTVLQFNSREWIILVPHQSLNELLKNYKNEISDALEQIISMVLKSENSDFLQKLVNFFFAEESDCKHIIQKDFGDYDTTINGCLEELYGESYYALDFEKYLKAQNHWNDSLKARISEIDFAPWNTALDNLRKIKNLINELQLSKADFENVMKESYSFKRLNEYDLNSYFKKMKINFSTHCGWSAVINLNIKSCSKKRKENYFKIFFPKLIWKQSLLMLKKRSQRPLKKDLALV